MTIQRLEHVGIVVDDLAAAMTFFVELGLKRQGEWQVEGSWVDRVVGPEGVRTESAMVETPDGNGQLELIKFHAPPGRGGDRGSGARASRTSSWASAASTAATRTQSTSSNSGLDYVSCSPYRVPIARIAAAQAAMAD